MKRVLVIVGAWAGATLLAAVVAWGAVSIVGNQVTDTVEIPLSASEVEQIAADRAVARAAATTAPASTPATTSPVVATTTAPPPVTDGIDTDPAATTTSVAPGTTQAAVTTTTPPPSSTVTTAAATTTTTTTTAAESEQTRAISVTGGTIVVRWSASGGVRLTSATPTQGWYVEVEKAGPPSVEVKFESTGDKETEVHVEVSDGQLRIDVGEE